MLFQGQIAHLFYWFLLCLDWEESFSIYQLLFAMFGGNYISQQFIVIWGTTNTTWFCITSFNKLTFVLKANTLCSLSLHYIEVIPKWNRNSLSSANLINQREIWSLWMNWAQFKNPVSHMCLAGAVVTSWSLTQEVAVCRLDPFTLMTNIIEKSKCLPENDRLLYNQAHSCFSQFIQSW